MKEGFEFKFQSTKQNYQSEIRNYRVKLERLKESFHKQEEEIEVKIKEK